MTSRVNLLFWFSKNVLKILKKFNYFLILTKLHNKSKILIKNFKIDYIEEPKSNYTIIGYV